MTKFLLVCLLLWLSAVAYALPHPREDIEAVTEPQEASVQDTLVDFGGFHPGLRKSSLNPYRAHFPYLVSPTAPCNPGLVSFFKSVDSHLFK